MRERLACIVFALVASCAENPNPHWDVRCVESHSEMRLSYGVGGVPVGGQTMGEPGMQMMPTTVCDRRDSTWVVPTPRLVREDLRAKRPSVGSESPRP